MKRFLSLILCGAMLSLVSCQQYTPPVVYKAMTGEKSIALKSATATFMVDLRGNVSQDEFLNTLKHELRLRGWRIIVDGITGRAGETQSVNSGADYTLLYEAATSPGLNPLKRRYHLNLSIAENKTGEEVVVLQGKTDDIEKTVIELAEAMDRYTTEPEPKL